MEWLAWRYRDTLPSPPHLPQRTEPVPWQNAQSGRSPFLAQSWQVSSPEPWQPLQSGAWPDPAQVLHGVAARPAHALQGTLAVPLHVGHFSRMAKSVFGVRVLVGLREIQPLTHPAARHCEWPV